MTHATATATYESFAAYRDALAAKGQRLTFTEVLAAFPAEEFFQLQAWNARWEMNDVLATAAAAPAPRLNPQYGNVNVNVWEGP